MTRKKAEKTKIFNVESLSLEDKIHLLQVTFADTLDQDTTVGVISVLYKNGPSGYSFAVGFPYRIIDDKLILGPTLKKADSIDKEVTYEISIASIHDYRRTECPDLGPYEVYTKK